MDAKISEYRKLLQDAPDDVDLWQHWGPFRQALRARYDAEHDIHDLDEIIQEDLKLLRAAPVAGFSLHTHAYRLGGLAVQFQDRCKRILNEKDTARALYFRRLAFALCPRDSLLLCIGLESHLALSMLVRAEEKGSLKMMNTACYHATHSLTAAQTINSVTGEGHSEQLDILANILRQRYRWTGSQSDLDRSIELSEVKTAMDRELSDARGDFHNLGYSLSLRYHLRGDIADLDQAINYAEMSLQGTLDPELHADRARNLSSFLEEKFQRSADVNHVRSAGKVLWDAKKKLATGSSREAALAKDVCRILRNLYQATKQTTDLEDALAAVEEGLASDHIPTSIRYKLMQEAGLTFLVRSKRYSSIEDATTALKYLEEAQRSAPGSAPRATITDNIANTYDQMYMITRDANYLRQAKTKSLEALSFMKDKDSSSMLLNAANKFLRLYLRDKKSANNQTDNLFDATIHIDRSLQAGRPWHEHWSQIRLSAGIIYEERYAITQDAEDFSSAITLFLECWTDTLSPLSRKLKAIIRASDLLARVERWTEAWEFLQAATTLIPAYCRPSLRRQDQQHIAADLYGLASRACAAGLMVGQVEKALELLEQGRGLLVASAHAAVSELSDLRREHRNLYQQFEFLKGKIYDEGGITPVGNKAQNRPYGQGKSETEAVLKSLGELVQRIRSKSGFDTFLLPMKCAQMRAMANDGAIVILNHTEIVSHAILVTKKSIKALVLQPRAEYSDINENLRVMAGHKLEQATKKNSGTELDLVKKNSTIRGMLAMLWRWVTEPVCNALELTRRRWQECFQPGHRGELRIWWMLTGDFVRLPIHAAGLWTGDCTNTVPMRAISSYIASFRMLAFVRDRGQNVYKAEPKALFISMARPDSTVSYHSKRMFLTSASKERDLVRSVNAKLSWSDLTRPSAQDVLQALPEFSYLHFATHGISDQNDPSASRLILMKQVPAFAADSLSSIQSDRLTVEDISRKTSENAVLAFLAACSTADSKVPALADEGLQIANAFQLAGFPHIIGTLWQANDSVCPGFARTFYEVLGSWSDEEPLSNDLIAVAANFASLVLIRDNMDQPRLWACFVHMGP